MMHQPDNPILHSKQEACANCGKVTQVVYFFNKKKNNLCEDCESNQKSQLSQDMLREEKKKRMDITDALKRINVHFNSDLDLVRQNSAISEMQQNLIHILKTYKKGFYLYGCAGSGKTTNMQIFAHYLIYTPVKHMFRQLDQFLFKTESKLIADIFALAKDDFDWNFQLAINTYMNHVKFVFIDEMAAKPLTDYELQIIDLLIHHVDELKNEMRLFITSNKSIDELKAHYSMKNDQNFADRIVSRLYSLTTPVKLPEIDHRKVN